jgi:hypothetical protein
MLALVLLVRAIPSRAEGPTIAGCLAASKASLKAVDDQQPLVERAQLRICASQNCPTEIREECLRRVSIVEDRLATITFTTAAPDASAIAIGVDGRADPDAIWGRPIFVQPGRTHTFMFTRAGQVVANRSLSLDPADRIIQDVAIAPIERPPTPARPMPLLRKVAWGAGAVMVASYAGSLAFGWLAKSKRDSAREICPAECPAGDLGAIGAKRWDDAVTAGRVSTVLFGVGTASLATAIVTWSLSRGPSDVQVAIGPDSLTLAGTF